MNTLISLFALSSSLLNPNYLGLADTPGLQFEVRKQMQVAHGDAVHITAKVDGYRSYFVASKDNLEQRPGREIVEQEMAVVPCRKPIEELDTLVDCSKVVAELGWDQPQSLDESLAKYKGREIIKPYN